MGLIPEFKLYEGNAIMDKIKIAIAGVGNCASSLVQGLHYYKDKNLKDAIGLMHWEIGGYTPGDIEVVAAFDIDRRKVGKNLNEAIFAAPNCTTLFCPDLPESGVIVHMGRVLDGFANHMREYEDKYTFLLANETEPDMAKAVEKFRTETNSVCKEIVVKRSELNALFRNDNPDEKKVAKLTGDLYDLETELQANVEKTGVINRCSYDHGQGMMGTYGRGRGGHMMGW